MASLALALVSSLSPLSLQLGPVPAPTSSTTCGRRAALAQGASAAAASLLLSSVPLPALADVRGVNQDMPRNEKEVNKYLTNMGFKPLKVPNGFSPLLQYIGTATPANIDGFKARERAFDSTLLVRFAYPNGWLVESPTITENGEAGNIGANNYVKGDSANFAALKLPKGETLTSLNKEFFKGYLSSQMANDVFEDVKVKKKREVTGEDGTQLLVIDFTYTLLTRAGFTVERSGVAGVQVVNDAVVGVVAATTALRYKELKESLTTICESFRASPVKAPSFGANSLI